MKISAIEIRDFKRIKNIKIEPEADRAVLLIGGKNAQGKSSILDALTAAFGGGKQSPVEPVRRGAEEAHITVRTDNGLEIERLFTAEGKAYLEVRSTDGATFKSPQAKLDSLVAGRFLDPLAFLNLDGKKQRATILELADKDRRIPALDEKRKSTFDKRTDANREVKRLDATLAEAQARLTDAHDTAPPNTDEDLRLIASYREQLADHRELLASYSNAIAQRDAIKLRINSAEADIAALMQRVVAEQAKLNEWNKTISDNTKSVGEFDTSTVTDRLKAAETRLANAAEIAKQAVLFASSRDAVINTKFALDTAQASVVALNETIAKIDARKAEILAAAKLPAGLAIADDGLVLNEVPLSQASGAEQFGVALELAMAANPALQDVWIRDGALLDDDHLADLEKLATAANVRLWVERVGSKDPGAIIISDGTIVAAGGAA